MGVIGVAGGTGSIYSTIIENSFITLTEIDVDLGLNKKIIHISDTHIDTSVFSVDTVVDKVSGVDPDLIVHTGDLITKFSGLDSMEKFLSRLSSIADLYAVLGNHDHWSGLTSSTLRRYFSSYEHIHILNNESVYLDGFYLVGVDDPYTFQDNLGNALREVDDSSTKILLAHSPQIIGKAKGKVDLVLSGHTHGGQVRVPFLGSIWIPLPPDYRKYDYGLFNVDGTYLFVTRGLGTIFLPIRFNCPPEVVILNV